MAAPGEVAPPAPGVSEALPPCGCGKPAEFLCDYLVDPAAKRTCDRPLCAGCRVVQATGIACSRRDRHGHGGCQRFSIDYCPEHAALARERLPNTATGPKPTPQQEAIYEAVAGGTSHLLVAAVAGAGKTTTSVEAAKRVGPGSKVGFVAFNKHIAEELQRRLGTAASASTLHSLGYAACRKTVRDVELEEGKALRHLRDLRPEWFWKGKNDVWRPSDEAQAAAELARLAKGSLVERGNYTGMERLANHHGLPIPEGLGFSDLFKAAQALLERCNEDVQHIDFDDMVWLPVIEGWPAGDFDLLLVDECQDLNRCQQRLALSACPAGRIALVGDVAQSIMGFSGADPEAVPRLAGLLKAQPAGLAECPLTVTFRCPTSHVALARQLVPAIEARDGAPEGVIRSVSPAKIGEELRPGDMVICRLNGPLVDLAYQLIAAGRPALLRGRDIGRGLVALIDRLKADSCEDLARKLAAYGEREKDRLERRGASASAVLAVEDKVECLSRLASQNETVDALRQFIGRLFVDDGASAEGKIVLSSIHRAKGLEAERVAIIAPEKLPLVRKDQQPWEVVQEKNILYVAITRAKSELLFAGDAPASLRWSPS